MDTDHGHPATGAAGGPGTAPPGTTAPNRLGALLLAGVLLLLCVSATIAPRWMPWINVGIVLVAVVCRYRTDGFDWSYLLLVALALAFAACDWAISPQSTLFPLLGAAPWITSFVLDYLDARRQRRAGSKQAAPAAGPDAGGDSAAPSPRGSGDPTQAPRRQGAPAARTGAPNDPTQPRSP